MPVKAGSLYTFGGYVRALSGEDGYKINVFWLDAQMKLVGVSNDWRSTDTLSGWTSTEFNALAPPRASYAAIHLAAGDSTQILVGHVFFQAAQSETNLVRDPDFTTEPGGWSVDSEPKRVLDIVKPSNVNYRFAVNRGESPELFAYIRNYLQLSASSNGGTTAISIQDYSLTLPSQRWFTVKVADPHATTATLLLIAAAIFLCVCRLALSLYPRLRVRPSPPKSRFFYRYLQLDYWLVIALLGALVYVIANSLLFGFGSMPFDMISQQTWSYTASTYGLADMYYRPFTATTLAPIWNGAPLNEPGYPYSFATVYLYGAIGWLNKLFLTGPAGSVATSFSSQFLIKLLNVIFALADGAIIFVLLRRVRLPIGQAAIGAALFLFNPAVLFAMSIWGQIETIGIFFILLSLYLAEAQWITAAWIALAIAAFTKPQVMFLTPLLAVIFLRRFPLGANLSGMAWATVISFLFLSPLALAISPSLPLDVVEKLVGIWGGAIDPSQSAVSGDSYSVWPLVTRFAAGQSQLARFFYPITADLVDHISYNTISNLLWAGVAALVVLCIAIFRKVDGTLERYMPFLALALFGFLMLKTGMSSRYFVYSLPLLILSRKSMPALTFYVMVAIASITIFIGIFGGFVFFSTPTPEAAPLFHQGGNDFAAFGMSLWSSDWFITLAVVGNICVFMFLVMASIRALFSAAPPSAPVSVGG